MPRGHKSKLRARERRHQAQCEIRSIQEAQAIKAEERDPFFLFSLCCKVVHIFSAAKSLGKSKNSQRPSTASVSAPGIKLDEGAKNKDEKRSSTSLALPSTSYSFLTQRDDLALSLVLFMLKKYSKRELITKKDILKHNIPQNKGEFSDILKKASELMVLTFGVDVKETDPTRHSYCLVNVLSPIGDEIMYGEAIMPKNGLLMTILCIIFMNGNCVDEEYVWEVLGEMGVHAGVDHVIYGNAESLITKDFVREGYLEYRQVPSSGSECYQFLWGPRAHYEPSKLRVLEFLAKVHNTIPSAFPSLYQDAVSDEQEITGARFADSD